MPPKKTAEEATVIPTDPMLRLYQKLHRIMEASPYLQKDKKNIHDGYNYLSEEKIKEHFQAQFVKEKLLLLPRQTIITSSTDTITNTGKKSHLTEISHHYSIVDIETGYSIEGIASGQGEDRADKGVYKAVTGAIKYALTNTFLMPAGNDPEEDEPIIQRKEQAQTEKKADPTKGTQPVNGVSKPPVINRTQFSGRQKDLAEAMDLFETLAELKKYYLELPKADQTLMYNYAQYLGDKLKGTHDGK